VIFAEVSVEDARQNLHDHDEDMKEFSVREVLINEKSFVAIAADATEERAGNPKIHG
jgi:hypothetical protein